MARTNGGKTEQHTQKSSAVTELEEIAMADNVPEVDNAPESENAPEPEVDTQAIDDSLNALKALLSAVEKLQKVRQEVGDIKSLLLRMLDGEVMSGEELEQLKSGVGGLARLVKAYGDHQTALTKAQPARELLDQVLKTPGTSS